MGTSNQSNLNAEIDLAIQVRDTVAQPSDQDDDDALSIFRGIFWASVISAPFWFLVGWWLW